MTSSSSAEILDHLLRVAFPHRSVTSGAAVAALVLVLLVGRQVVQALRDDGCEPDRVVRMVDVFAIPLLLLTVLLVLARFAAYT